MNYNKITPFKNRKIDYRERVRVHRCLNQGVKEKVYSIIQHGLVAAHGTHITLVDCTFTVNKGGQAKVRATGHKNVHAWIEGKISKRGAMGSTAVDSNLPAIVTYNPYKDKLFCVRNLTVKPQYIREAFAVYINQHGVSAAYVD